MLQKSKRFRAGSIIILYNANFSWKLAKILLTWKIILNDEFLCRQFERWNHISRGCFNSDLIHSEKFFERQNDKSSKKIFSILLLITMSSNQQMNFSRVQKIIYFRVEKSFLFTPKAIWFSKTSLLHGDDKKINHRLLLYFG
jgi:hypothetical protein